MSNVILILALLVSTIWPIAVNAQIPDPERILSKCLVAAQKPKSPKSKIISYGVLNGRAIDLVKPVYPASASAVGISGSVQISVVIDEAGCVSEAQAISGHPLLIPASLKAAWTSLFEPVLISGNPVRVYGVIFYKYLPNQMNWLELGFASDSYETLLEYLPSDLPRERRLLSQSRNRSFDDKEKILQSVVDSIQTILKSDAKNLWLFNVGRQIRSLELNRWSFQELEKVIKQIQLGLDKSPSEVSIRLRVRLKELLDESDRNEFDRRLQVIKNRLFDLGN